MDFPTLRILVLLVALLPFGAAVAAALSGRAARRVALIFALVHLGLVAAVAMHAAAVLEDRAAASAGTVDPRPGSLVFTPEFVPGAGELSDASAPGIHRTTWNLLTLAPSAAAKPGEPGPNVQFFLGVDGLNLWLVAMASFMMIPALAVSWESVTDRPAGYYAWLFVLQGGAVGAFLSFDVILFYVFFELTLIPAFFLIGGWGAGSGRRDAARTFFLYTLAGSLLTLVGVVGVVLTNPGLDGQVTFSLPDLMANVQRGLAVAGPDRDAKVALQFWLFLALMAGFAVKVALWPFHTWLPSAYGEAPLGVTILLSAVLAKLGAFGILRFVLPLTPDAALAYGLPAVGALAAVGIVYGALCAFAQRDMKQMIAYSSVSHLGFLVLGLLCFNAEGLTGATLHMVNHGVSTGALFALLAFLLDRYKTTDTTKFGGLIGRYPAFAFLFFVATFASIGLPGLNNFVSEMVMLAGLFDARNPGAYRLGLAAVAAFGILLSAWYMLTLLQRSFFQAAKEPPAAGPVPASDVTGREAVAFGSLAVVCLALGLFPTPVLRTIEGDARTLAAIGDAARLRAAPAVQTPPAPPKKAEPAKKGPAAKKGPPAKKGPAPKKDQPPAPKKEEAPAPAPKK